MSKDKPASRDAATAQTDTAPECFVIMPIGDADGYSAGHFRRVYNDVIVPACTRAGFLAIRGDDVKQTNLIHLDVLQRLLDSPMAVCDLSSRNPNVLFELALRQAFDKPVTLIQEIGTKAIFDISPLRYTEYRKERIYHEVLEDQEKIATAIKDTFNAAGDGKSINSIVKLLSLAQPARLKEPGQVASENDLQRLILSEIGQLRSEFRLGVRSREDVETRRHLASQSDARLHEVQDTIAMLESLVTRDDVLHPQPGEVASVLSYCRSQLQELKNRPLRHSTHVAAVDAELQLDRVEMRLRQALEHRVDKQTEDKKQ